jgi:hypothetical protein
MLSNRESRTKTRSIGFRFAGSYDFDNIRKRSRRHRKKIDETSGVLRKKDDVSLDSEKRRWIISLSQRNNIAADNKSSDQEFLYPSQVSEFFSNKSNPAEICKRFRQPMIFEELVVTSPT